MLALKANGTPVRKIARLLKISRNSVRQAIRRPPPQGMAEPEIPTHLRAPISAAFVRCEGNVVRVHVVAGANPRLFAAEFCQQKHHSSLQEC